MAKVLRALRKEIYSGLRLPRERLVESDLALSFSVSRMVIRQALATLKTEGLVEIAPYKGASVAPISIKSIRENYQILSVLEGFATGLAAAGLRPEDLDNLKNIVKQQRALDPGDVKEWQRLNQDFHRTIEKACGNRRLGELIRRYAYF
ncbi:MAG: GntR family transcriptional regulator, partial [Deltaproteobacteria bacterium]|nr:GntR family transcriptional regulator [Deltaproteobacteria bacterium]